MKIYQLILNKQLFSSSESIGKKPKDQYIPIPSAGDDPLDATSSKVISESHQKPRNYKISNYGRFKSNSESMLKSYQPVAVSKSQYTTVQKNRKKFSNLISRSSSTRDKLNGLPSHSKASSMNGVPGESMESNYIQADEEGTNLNVKGIKTNYTKHYNSKYRIENEHFISCQCKPLVLERDASDMSCSLILDTSVQKDENGIDSETGQGEIKSILPYQQPNIKICCQFCVNVPAWTQKSVIIGCLTMDHKRVGGKHSSTIAHVNFPNRLKSYKQRRFVVTSSWWRRWCDYTNFDENDTLLQENKDNLVNADDEVKANLTHLLSSNSHMNPPKDFDATYDHPGKILNAELLMSPRAGCVRSDIIEFHDYVTFDHKTWNYLYNWFGVDYCLMIEPSHDTLQDSLSLECF